MYTEPEWITFALSSARFRPYLAATDGDLTRAIQLYRWNVEISAAFYPLLHWLEVAARNAMHVRLGARFGSVSWWEVAPLHTNSRRLVEKARGKVESRRQDTDCSPDDIVTELSFGFWVSLISRGYDRHLWVPCLHRAFPGYRGKRARLYEQLLTMVLLRNRIMHHEPIHHRHLQADHDTIYRLVGHLSPELTTQLAPFDRVPKLLQDRP